MACAFFQLHNTAHRNAHRWSKITPCARPAGAVCSPCSFEPAGSWHSIFCAHAIQHLSPSATKTKSHVLVHQFLCPLRILCALPIPPLNELPPAHLIILLGAQGGSLTRNTAHFGILKSRPNYPSSLISRFGTQVSLVPTVLGAITLVKSGAHRPFFIHF